MSCGLRRTSVWAQILRILVRPVLSRRPGVILTGYASGQSYGRFAASPLLVSVECESVCVHLCAYFEFAARVVIKGALSFRNEGQQTQVCSSGAEGAPRYYHQTQYPVVYRATGAKLILGVGDLGLGVWPCVVEVGMAVPSPLSPVGMASNAWTSNDRLGFVDPYVADNNLRGRVQSVNAYRVGLHHPAVCNMWQIRSHLSLTLSVVFAAYICTRHRRDVRHHHFGPGVPLGNGSKRIARLLWLGFGGPTQFCSCLDVAQTYVGSCLSIASRVFDRSAISCMMATLAR